MPINFNLEGLEEKDIREIKYLLQEINDTLEGGIWHTNIKAGAITGVLSDSLFNTKIGTEALKNNTIGYRNSVLGYQTLYSNIEGYGNAVLGYQVLHSNISGYHNSAFGYQALYLNTTGFLNTVLGKFALRKNTKGYYNVAVGAAVLRDNTTGRHNTAVGARTYSCNTTGHYNTAIGAEALDKCTTGYYNIGIGYRAGHNEMGSYKLYIDSSETTTPLIYGEFDNDLIAIYGNLGIGTRVFGTSATRTLAMLNGTIPSTSPANAIQLYAEDVTASSELKVRDEATNVTTLSPHNFELFKPDKDDPFPWSYHSINYLIGKKVNADISGALRELEKLTGKQFIHYEDINKISSSEYLKGKEESLIADYITENTTEIEVEKNEAWGEVEIEEQDTNKIIGNDIEYEFDEKTGEVKEIKKPKYGNKTALKNKLKSGFRFNEETGKFLKVIKPTEKQAEKAIKGEPVLPDWIKDRL